MSDEEGKATTPYKFTITNNSNTDVKFSLKLLDDTSKVNTLNIENIKVNLTGSNEIDVAVLKGLSDNELDAGILSANSSRSYELRIWIKEDATNDTIGKQYNGKLTLDTKQTEHTGIKYAKGDVNMNGILDFLDSEITYDYAFDKIDFTKEQQELADVDGDNRITMADSRTIFSQLSTNMLSYKLLDGTLSSDNPTFTNTSTDNGVFVQYRDGTKTKNGMRVYYYRGPVENNYVQFGTYKTSDGGNTIGQPIIWRIVKVNEDASIQLITQNNIGVSSFWNLSGIAKYINDDGTNSDIKNTVENWYNKNIAIDSTLDNNVKENTYCNDITGIDFNDYTVGSA